MINSHLKTKELITKYGHGKSIYEMAKTARANYTTLHRLVISEPGSITGVQIDTLYQFLTGLGLSADDINGLAMGEVFSFPAVNES